MYVILLCSLLLLYLTDPLQTPVHYAVIHNSLECLDSLLEWGGDLYQRDKSGKSPLDYFTNAFPLTTMNALKKYSAGK